MVRDPRDVAVSYYHYRKWLNEYNGTLSRFVRLFVDGNVDTYGSWGDHVRSWRMHEHDCVLFLRFEDLVSDTQDALTRAATFLQIKATPTAVRNAVAHNAAAKMRAKERSAHSAFAARTDPRRSFVRSAQAGGWRVELAEDDAASIATAFEAPMRRLGYLPASATDASRSERSQAAGPRAGLS
jgi:hypothetical protein